MRARALAAWVPLTMLLTGASALAEEPVPLYTSEDLDRMFGPPPPTQVAPIASSAPEDWAWIEQYIDRQYARIDADRQYDLNRAALRIADERTDVGAGYGSGYGYYYPSLRLGYPASTWWNTVHASYGGGSWKRGGSCKNDGMKLRGAGRPSVTPFAARGGGLAARYRNAPPR
ncbi:MAG TPA: hypothetical protein VFB67_01025 [Candidatus Polarisedimenticolaceae bacterium]|nr:hypothetical protein [Candidatus Polarisedimenticolaceae bacterium]